MSKKNDVPRVTLEQQQIKRIGRALRIARLDLSLQVQEVANASGVSRVTVSNVEKGQLENLSLAILNKMAEAVNMKLVLTLEDKSKK